MANQKLTTEQAISVLIQGVNIAQGKGAYSLEDATLINMAVKTIQPPKDAPEQVKEKAQPGQNVNEDEASEYSNKKMEAPSE